MTGSSILKGPRCVIDDKSDAYPKRFADVYQPPKRLYVLGSLEALEPGLAIIGARKATPYGRSCAKRFALLAAEKGVNIISGGARGCDSEAHKAALEAKGSTVVFLGGGFDQIYPPEHFSLFQRIIDNGGALVSEHPSECPPLPYAFRARNRLIAGLAKAVLIVEAGLRSGTFSTAEFALQTGRDVIVVPGAITSPESRGSNRLLLEGARPVIDDESFEDLLFGSFGVLKRPPMDAAANEGEDPLVAAIRAQPMSNDDLLPLAFSLYGAADARAKLAESIGVAETRGLIARRPDGLWGPVVKG